MRRILLLFVVLFLLDCGHRSANTPTLRVAYRATIVSLDPIMENSLIAVTINNNNIYEPLVTRNIDLEITSALAVNWVATDDRTWMIQLRPGVRFQDGTPLRAEDVKFSLERARKESFTKIADTVAMIEKVQVTGADRIKIITRQPYSTLLNRLAEVMIVSKKYFSKPNEPQDIPPGTGPYRVKSWTPGKIVELEENPYYWGPKPEIKRVIFEAIPELKERIRGLTAGQIDILPLLEPDALEDATFKNDRHIRILSTTGLGVIYLGMDLLHEKTPYASTSKNPFRDIRVRKAIYQAVNIRHIAKGILKGYADEATQMVTSQIFGYSDEIQRLLYDPVQARKLMAEAGYANGFTVRFDFSNNRYRNDEQIGRSIAADLEQIGIHAQLNPMPKEKLFATLNARDTSLYMVGWYLSSGDATSMMDFLLHSRDACRGYGSENVGGYSNAQVDQLIEMSAGITNPIRRLEILRKAMKVAMNEVPYVPLHIESTLVAASADLDWTPRPDEFIRAKDIRLHVKQ